jgi:RNA polymerase-binding protein DksA
VSRRLTRGLQDGPRGAGIEATFAVGRGRRSGRPAERSERMQTMKISKKAPKKASRKAPKKAGRKAPKKAVKRTAGKTTRKIAKKATKKPARKPSAMAAKRATPRKLASKAGRGTPRVAEPSRGRARAMPLSPRVQWLKAMLESKGAEIVEKIKRARADSVDVDRSSFAEVGDLVSASVEKEKAFEYGEAGVNALREIAGALEKLKEGTYGICERCSKPIGVRRLEAMPSARLCVKCKAKEEATGKPAQSPLDELFED